MRMDMEAARRRAESLGYDFTNEEIEARMRLLASERELVREGKVSIEESLSMFINALFIGLPTDSTSSEP